jgi:uroporphyrin-3 C-methyltransferase
MHAMEDTAATDPPAPDKPRKLYVLVRLAALCVVVVIGFGVWWSTRDAHREDVQTQRAQFEALTHEVAQLRSTLDTLRGRQEDSDKVDKSVREQLLGLDRRTQLVEDSIANLADKRLSAHDALALDEAELLLTLGGERYALFHDAAAAVATYRQADIALSEIEDAAFSTVRQSIAAETAALNEAQAGDSTAATSKLARLREQTSQWPPAGSGVVPAAVEPESRLARVFGAFVQVRRDDATQTRAALHAPSLARELFLVDLHEAQAAALARDETRYRAALASARAEFNAAFDQQTPAVAAAGGELDALSSVALTPPMPTLLGTALKELRNLRATHALREGKAASRSGAESK